jgi:hypothetical protein
LHAANVDGLLLAENLKIPSVMVAPPFMLGLASEKTSPWKGIKDFIKRRYYSITRDGKFVQLNKVWWEDSIRSLLLSLQLTRANLRLLYYS